MTKKKEGASLFVGNNVVIYYDGQTITVSRKFAVANGIPGLISEGKWYQAVRRANRALQIEEATNKELEVRDGQVYYGNAVVHSVLAARILEFQEQGLPYEPLLLLLKGFMENPSPHSREQAFKFLEHRNLPVTPRGTFLAYKALRPDYTSKYKGNDDVEVSTDGGKTWKVFRGHIPNPIGGIVRMKRDDVDSDYTCECSVGLHCGALGYAGFEGWYYSPGDKVVVVEIDPRHVVSVPNDHDAQKMRVEQYKVIGNFKRALAEPLVSTGDEQEQDAIEDADDSLQEYDDTCDYCGDDPCTCDDDESDY